MKSVRTQCLLDDGRWLTVHATCRPRDGRAEIKCPGPRAISQQVLTILRLARHTEARYDSRQQVVITLDPWPAPHQREWELALVLADRMVRGIWQAPAEQVIAHGHSGRWESGVVQGGAVQRYLAGPSSNPPANPSGSASQVLVSAPPDPAEAHRASLPGALTWLPITHLGALHGHADDASQISTVRTWFPLYSGGPHDSLSWVEVSVRPLAAPPAQDDDVISVLGLDLQQQQAVQQVLLAARQFDAKSTRHWRTVVRFELAAFYGESYQFALVMADRIARGRDFPARGRLIATGRSGAWHAGVVEAVDALDAKCALILAQSARGDRVLLPLDWEAGLPAQFMTQLAAKGVSCACVGKIGLL